MSDAAATHACTRKPADVDGSVERDGQQWWLHLESADGDIASTPIVCCPWCGLMLQRPVLNMRSLHDAVEVG